MSETYLLIWPSHVKDPLYETVRVLSIKEMSGGWWVEFEFLTGESRGNLSGAPIEHIITAKEKSIIESAATENYLKRQQAKSLQDEVRRTYRSVTRNLHEHDRIILLTPKDP